MLARRPVWVRLEPPCFFFSASLAEQTQGSHHESRGDTVSSSVATMTDLTSPELLFKNMFSPFTCYNYNFLTVVPLSQLLRPLSFVGLQLEDKQRCISC